MFKDDKQKILNLYAILFISIALSMVPSGAVSVIALVFFLGAFIAAYIFRKQAEIHGLLENHMTYIIRTVWIAGLFGAISTILASLYMIGRIDYAPITPCGDALAAQGIDALQTMGASEVMTILDPCMGPFWNANQMPFLTAAAIAALPVLAYVAYRFGKGIVRATKGYRLADPQEWF